MDTRRLKLLALAGLCTALMSGVAYAEALPDAAAAAAGQYQTSVHPVINAFGHAGNSTNVTDDGAHNLPVTTDNELPAGAAASTGNANGANAIETASLAAVTAKTNYVCQVKFTASGATSGLAVAPTITGLAGGTKTYAFVFPAGAFVQATPLTLDFRPCLPASAVNTAISAVLPAGGTGNTQASADIEGFVK